jgi:exonuclease VII small subunit
MAYKPDVSSYESFGQISQRLDEIVGLVRSKDVSLERSLDLFDEAIALGSKAVEMVDTAPAEDSQSTAGPDPQTEGAARDAGAA